MCERRTQRGFVLPLERLLRYCPVPKRGGGNPDGMRRLRTRRYDVTYRVCLGLSDRISSLHTFASPCLRFVDCVNVCARVRVGGVCRYPRGDTICRRVSPCSGRNPAATGSRAGRWAEGSSSATSLPGRGPDSPSRPPPAGVSTRPSLRLSNL